MGFKILENRICNPDKPNYQENVNWLLGLWNKCECGHNKGFHDKEVFSKDGSCSECDCKEFKEKCLNR